MEGIKGWPNAIREYVREVLGELAKVAWPSTETLIKHTGIVVAMVAIIAGFLFVLDWPLGIGLTWLVGQ